MGLGKFADLRGSLANKRGVLFLRKGGGGDTLMHTMSGEFILPENYFKAFYAVNFPQKHPDFLALEGESKKVNFTIF